MDPLLKDWIQVAQWSVAIIGGLIAAFLAISQWRANTEQRKNELRWKQANLGRELVDDLFETKAGEALLMLDYHEVDISFPSVPGEDKKVVLNDILIALDLQKVSKSEKSMHIRWCFDELFYNLERFEYFIENKLLTFPDVSCPMEYYVDIIYKQKKEFASYMDMVKYRRAIKFLNRFPKWSEA